MKPNDLQQLAPGFRTVEVIGGPVTVRVHEALDASYQNTPHRHFLTVDLKFRECDALNIGEHGWLGCTKSEATREARHLADRLYATHLAMEAAKDAMATHESMRKQHAYTLQLQEKLWNKLTSRYCAEITE